MEYYCYFLPPMGKAKKVETKAQPFVPTKKRERRIFHFVTEAIDYLECELDMRVDTLNGFYYLDGENSDLYTNDGLIELAQELSDQEN